MRYGYFDQLKREYVVERAGYSVAVDQLSRG